MWLTSDGKRGETFADYGLARAARYWRVPPWDLEQQPVYWQNLANQLEAVEGEAREMNAARDARRARVTDHSY